ncbi:MAG: hypothetical protein K1X85_03825 [Ignavibacteria bacterium]|nr:hypothetical protein [Ignavibacteria bacterium]
MQRSSLLEMIGRLTAEEAEKFEEFLKSPYFNKNSSLIRMFMIIRKTDHVTDNAELKKENIWSKLYPDKPYNYGTMKNLIHEMNQLCLKFVCLEELENSRHTANVLTVSALSSRNAGKALKSKLNQIEKTFLNKSFRDLDYVLSDYYLEMSKIFWTKWFHQKTYQLKRPSEKDFLAGSATTVYSFLLYLFKLTNNIRVQSYDYNYTLEKNLVINFLLEVGPEKIEKILSMVKEISAKDYKALNVFWKMCKSQLTKPSVELYLDFKDSLSVNASLFCKNDLEDLLNCLVTTLFRLDEAVINKYRQRIEIFDIMIANKIFVRPGMHLPVHLFNLYVWNLFNLSDFEGIQKFTDKYAGRLYHDKKQNSLEFSDTCLLIGNCDFEKALEKLTKINYDYAAMKIYVKHLKAICYYELNDYSAFIYENDSLKSFLRSNLKVNEYVKNNLKNHFRFTGKLFHLRSTSDAAEFRLLKDEITSHTANESSWLIRKVNELNPHRTRRPKR